MGVEVVIHYLEFLKAVPGSLALMADLSLYDLSNSSNSRFLGFRFSFFKMRISNQWPQGTVLNPDPNIPVLMRGNKSQRSDHKM